MVDDFSIGALAERTGVTPNVLRTWENRFGFPTGRRTAAGHRRFTEADVLLVDEVLAARERGVPLHLAVDAVLQRARHERRRVRPRRRWSGSSPTCDRSGSASRRCWPPPTRSRTSASRAPIASVVLGTFQEGHKFARSRHRWDELGRTATWSAVLADFAATTPWRADPQARPARCQLPADSPMRREWTVVTLSPTFAAVLAAWEVPAASRGSPRPSSR